MHSEKFPLLNSTIRLLHISSPLSWRGGEQQLFYLFEGLKKKGISSKIFCPKNSALSNKLTDGEKILYKKRSGFDLLAAARLARICKKDNINVIHAHDAHGHTTAVLAASIFGNTPQIVLSRRVDFPIGKSMFSRFKYNHSKITAIVSVSNTIQGVIKPQITADHVHLETVHSGVDLSRFQHVEPIDLRSSYNLGAEIRIIANVAALAEQKDYFTFLETAKQILLVDKNIVFIIFGSGPMEKEIKTYCTSLKLDDHVIFAGFRNDLPAVYPNINILLFTSKTEGLGTTVLDAFANHIPVISTNAGGIPEMVIHEETGLLAPVGDSKALTQHIIRVLNDQKLGATLANNAYKKLDEFTVDRLVSKTLIIYQKIINKSFILNPI